MIQQLIHLLYWFGIFVFSATGALAASRKEMDLVGFALLGSITGIGGGTIRNLFLGVQPIFWVEQPAYLVACIIISKAIFFFAHILNHRYRLLLWLDAVGLALFAVTGSSNALAHGASPVIAVAMGVASASFGGIIRDILGGGSPIILRQEIYITAALAGALVYVLLSRAGIHEDITIFLGFLAAFGLRAMGLYWGLSLPRYRALKDHDDA